MGLALRGGGSSEDLKEVGPGCDAAAKGAPRASRGEVRGPQTAPSRIIDEAELLCCFKTQMARRGWGAQHLRKKAHQLCHVELKGAKGPFSMIQATFLQSS